MEKKLSHQEIKDKIDAWVEVENIDSVDYKSIRMSVNEDQIELLTKLFCHMKLPFGLYISLHSGKESDYYARIMYDDNYSLLVEWFLGEVLRQEAVSKSIADEL